MNALDDDGSQREDDRAARGRAKALRIVDQLPALITLQGYLAGGQMGRDERLSVEVVDKASAFTRLKAAQPGLAFYHVGETEITGGSQRNLPCRVVNDCLNRLIMDKSMFDAYSAGRVGAFQ